MKTISIIMGAAFLIVTAVLVSLVIKGGALKPAGAIKPTEIGADPSIIGKQLDLRLFPDFDAAKFVVWRVESEALVNIPKTALQHYRGHQKPTLLDLRSGGDDRCEENCWYILNLNSPLPDKTKDQRTAEVFVQHFDRNEPVPVTCETQKILTVDCMRPVSVREVRRKIRSKAPHFFMQRYQAAQFYLYIERGSAQ